MSTLKHPPACETCRGFVRGLGMSVNQAVHLPGAGDFVLEQIAGPQRPDPTIGFSKRRKSYDTSMDVDTEAVAVLARADPQEQESLQRENVPDPLDAEQTWPTNEARHSLSYIPYSLCRTLESPSCTSNAMFGMWKIVEDYLSPDRKLPIVRAG